MECWADCYDGRTSRKRKRLLRLTDEQHITLVSDDGETRYRIQDLVVSRRLGRTSRRIEMPDGVVCEVFDNDAVDWLLATSGSPVPGRLVDRLESSLRYVVVACVLTGLFLWGAIGTAFLRWRGMSLTWCRWRPAPHWVMMYSRCWTGPSSKHPGRTTRKRTPPGRKTHA